MTNQNVEIDSLLHPPEMSIFLEPLLQHHRYGGKDTLPKELLPQLFEASGQVIKAIGYPVLRRTCL
jgi:hypothetical protein